MNTNTCLLFSIFSYIIYEKIAGGRGSAPDPAEGAHNAPPRPAGWNPRQLANVALAASHPMTRAFGAHHGMRFPNYDHLSVTVINFERIFMMSNVCLVFSVFLIIMMLLAVIMVMLLVCDHFIDE